MKKILLIVLILICKTIFSQETFLRNEVGISLSSIFRTPTTTYYSSFSEKYYKGIRYNRQGYGLYYNYKFNKNISISCLPYYSKVDFRKESIFRGYIIQYKSIEFVLPISLKLSSNTGKKTNYYLGLSMNNVFLFNEYIHRAHCDDRFPDQYGNIYCSTHINENKYRETFEFSLYTGISINLPNNYIICAESWYNIVRREYDYGYYRELSFKLNIGYKF